MKWSVFIWGMCFVLVCTSFHTNAQDISLRQRILMPGQLIEGHAELEPDCNNCHLNFQQEEMTTLCLDCHEDIDADRSALSGFHGKSQLALNSSCDGCHTDHEGRDADILGLFVDRFNHNETDFPLSGMHDSVSCEGCHELDDKHSQAPVLCSGCHADNDIHGENLGDECESCHQVTGWNQLLPFDHQDRTGFVLSGIHNEISCNSCHFGQQYQYEATDCLSCHQNNDVHLGLNGDRCDGCHAEESWSQVTFNHDETGFILSGVHTDVACIGCHENGVEIPLAGLQSGAVNQRSSCSSCHLADDVHFGRNGDSCDTCHADSGWAEVTFSHALDTDYELNGKHSELSCTNCHTGSLDTELPTDCMGCHLADDVHQLQAMNTCSDCHVPEEWHSVTGFDHEFTNFPLLGLHSIVSCENCHFDMQFSATDTECSTCHGFEDIHEDTFGSDCHSCHTPNAWELWQFDHGLQTSLTLTGSHNNLSCHSCHLPGSIAGESVNDCVACHRNEDVHFGDFGSDCQRCHSTTSFSEPVLQGISTWPE